MTNAHMSVLILSCKMPYVVQLFFFFNDTATTEIYTLSLHDALPICWKAGQQKKQRRTTGRAGEDLAARSEEHTSELQSRLHLVCRHLLEKKKEVQKVLFTVRLRAHVTLKLSMGQVL